MSTSQETPNLSANFFRAKALPFLKLHLIAIIALMAILIPTFLRLAQQSWSTDAGAHAPIVLATGLWLLARGDWSKAPSERNGRTRAVFVPLIFLAITTLAAYVFGRAYDFLSIEAGALYVSILAILAGFLGIEPLKRNAFPLVYLGFLVPPPGWLIDRLTAPLQEFISFAATAVLQYFDYPVSRNGVSINIAQYQLLVEEACSGMNSIIGLVAITLFYIYILHRASWRYAVLLIALILPVAIFANFIRVVVLILLTYHYGDAVAQGFLHGTAGIALFAVALFLMIGIDALLRRTFFAEKAQ